MTRDIKYKKQGDGLDSWVVKTYNASGEIINQELVYEDPNIKEVALWKVRAILSVQGLLTKVDEEINKLPEPNKTLALMSWEYGTVISSDSPTVKFIQSVLGLTDEQVSSIFDSAESLKV